MHYDDTTDLNSPPPVPNLEPPKPPAQERKVLEQTPKPKKRSGMTLGLFAGVLAAAVLLCGYRFVHIWTEASCAVAAECVICGIQKDGFSDHNWVRGSCEEPAICSVCAEAQTQAAGHDWSGGNCTEAKVCMVCAATEPAGHTYESGVCIVCGAERGMDVLKWEPESDYGVTFAYDPESRAMELSVSALENFSRMTIVIRDSHDQMVSTDRYTIDRTESAVTLNLPSDLNPGRYSVHAGVQEMKVLSFCFGTYGAWMSADTDKWFADFETKNWKHGHWLAAFEENAPLRGVQTEEEASRFSSPWHMSGADYAEDGAAVLTQGGSDQKFLVDEYLRISDTGEEETAYTFRFSGWYLTMDSTGKVFLTDILTDDCLWIMTSSL